MEKLYLSRRNLLTLLSKLNRKQSGEPTSCTIVKERNEHDPYVNTMEQIYVTAVEDADFYNREPGEVHPRELRSF